MIKKRQAAILELLQHEGKAEIHALSRQLKANESCIRRDLIALEKKGQVKRFHGGAMLVETEIVTPEPRIYTGEIMEAKRRIACQAAGMIVDRDLVFLGISPCSAALAELLVQSEKKCTVVTDMIEVMSILARSPRIRLLAVGGAINDSREGFVSAQTVELIRSMRPSLAFIDAKGIDVEENAVYVDDAEEKTQKQAVIRASERTYVMLESEKFSFVGRYRYAELGDIRGIITDAAPRADVAQRLLEHEVELLTPEAAETGRQRG